MENKTLAIIKISLLSFISFLLTIILIILLINPKKSWNIFELSSKSELVYENKIEDNIKEINVTTKAAAIEIKKSTKNYIEVKYYGEKDDKELTLTKENQILEINENKNKLENAYKLEELSEKNNEIKTESNTHNNKYVWIIVTVIVFILICSICILYLKYKKPML